jgi:hypothetical protein
MYFILEVDNNIFNIYDDRNAALIHLFKLNKFSKQIQLNEFKNGYINGEYIIKNNIIYYSCLDSDNNISIIEIKDLPYEIKKASTKKLTMNVDQINVNVLKVEGTQIQKTEKQEVASSDINVRLPVINTEINITTNVEEEVEEEEVDLEELKKKIEELSKLKEKEVEDLENLNEKFNDYHNKVIEEKFSLDAEKLKLKQNKEKWEEFKNIFNADKKIYKIMKEQIANNDIEKIPELFEKKYPIFKILDENNFLDTQAEIYEYVKLLPDDDSVYIPKNIALKGMFEDSSGNGPSSISLTELKGDNNFETTIDTDENDE